MKVRPKTADFNPSMLRLFGVTIDVKDSVDYAAASENTAIPRLEVREIRFIPQRDNYSWEDNNYTFTKLLSKMA